MYHNPVLLNECIDGLNINPNGIYVDVTFGGGGHSRAAFVSRFFPTCCSQNHCNIRGDTAFCVPNSSNQQETSCIPDTNNMRVRHILLVDDTFTTGSTLNACRAVLRQAFPLPVRISVATLAYVNSD